MAHPILAGVLLVLTLSAWSPATAEADGVKVFIGGTKGHPHGFVVPHPIFIVPSPPPCTWIPSYWTYQWVPQSYTHNVWVAGHWSPDGTWIEGHYEARMVSTGYYQQVWMGGRCVR